ncbi:MAG: O-antigen ligase family protein [Pseudomonadota bacterium]
MIALLQTSAIFLSGLRSFVFAACLYLMFLAFAPRTLGFSPTGSDFSITFPRLAFPLLALSLLIYALSKDRERFLSIGPLLRSPFMIVLILLGAHRIIGTAYNGVPLVYALESILFSVIVLAVFYLVASPMLFRAVNLVLLAVIAILVVLIPLELALQQPLHHFVADPALVRLELLETRTLNRGYRIQGGFDNSLKLAEFLLYCIPFALFRANGSARQYAGWLMLAAIMGIGLLTASRGFMIFSVITIASFYVFLSWTSLSRAARSTITVLVIPLFLLVGIGGGVFIEEMIQQASGIRFDQVADSRARSLYSRALQFQQVFDTVSQSPVFGSGMLQNVTRTLFNISNIDNYYLRTLLESGWPGFVLLLLSLGLLLRQFMSYRPDPADQAERAFFALCCSLTVAFACSKIFLSMPTNNQLFFALVGLLLGLKAYSQREAAEHARSVDA